MDARRSAEGLARSERSSATSAIIGLLLGSSLQPSLSTARLGAGSAHPEGALRAARCRAPWRPQVQAGSPPLHSQLRGGDLTIGAMQATLERTAERPPSALDAGPQMGGRRWRPTRSQAITAAIGLL